MESRLCSRSLPHQVMTPLRFSMRCRGKKASPTHQFSAFATPRVNGRHISPKSLTPAPLERSQKRRIMPNFARIHAAHFSKLKSIEEYARKTLECKQPKVEPLVDGSNVTPTAGICSTSKTVDKLQVRTTVTTDAIDDGENDENIPDVAVSIEFQTLNGGVEKTEAGVSRTLTAPGHFSIGTSGLAAVPTAGRPEITNLEKRRKMAVKQKPDQGLDVVSNTRSKQKGFLEGVRLNRRFQLLMKSRGIDADSQTSSRAPRL